MKKTPLYIALAVMLASCGTQRNAPTPPPPSPTSRPAPTVKVPSGRKPAVQEKKASTGDDIEREARRWLGTPYKYGGKERSGTDCSGMVMAVYETSTGLKLPRDSRSQQEWCTRIDRSKLRKGDLVFFSSKAGGGSVSHVGIYIEDDKFIHASTSRGVIISELTEKYYERHFHSAGRVPGLDSKTGAKVSVSRTEMRADVPQTKPAPKVSEVKIPVKETPVDSVRKPTDEADSIRAEVIRAMKF